VIWVWNPNIIAPMPQVKLRPFYPGDSYVDWVGVTGYFPTTGPQTYTSLFEPTMTEIRRFTAKPFIIAETSVETGPAEVACVQNLVSTVTSHSDVLGFIWFDIDKDGIDWRVESRPAVRAAMATDVRRLRHRQRGPVQRRAAEGGTVREGTVQGAAACLRPTGLRRPSPTPRPSCFPRSRQPPPTSASVARLIRSPAAR
jgi:hypothetical protein